MLGRLRLCLCCSYVLCSVFACATPPPPRKACVSPAVGVSYSAENHRDVLKKEKERLQAEIRREYRDIQETQVGQCLSAWDACFLLTD